jgi:hypothetical protein
LSCGVAAAQEAKQLPPASGKKTLTGKEKLSDKASDEQRVNDCNVPPEKRGASRRPADCAPPRQAQTSK